MITEIQFGQLMAIIILGLMWTLLPYSAYKIWTDGKERPVVVMHLMALAIVTPMVLYHVKLI